jgi:hypothetical protein
MVKITAININIGLKDTTISVITGYQPPFPKQFQI